jgi:hypothetical protein
MPPILMPQDGQPPDMAPGSYYPQEPSDHLTGGLPINLDSLRDGPPGSKPFYPYSTLIRYAIKGSPHQKLLLEDIYYAIESRVCLKLYFHRFICQHPYLSPQVSVFPNSTKRLESELTFHTRRS